MNHKYSIVILCLFATLQFGCHNAKTPPPIKSSADSTLLSNVIKMFEWKAIHRGSKIYLMIVIDYSRGDLDSTESMAIIVEKVKNAKRPTTISFVVPNNVKYSTGIAFEFANVFVNVSKKIDFDKSDMWVIPYKSRNEKHFTTELLQGYIIDDESFEKVDLFKQFMSFNHLFISLFYPDGSRKSISVPLYSFNKQFSNL